MLKKILFLTLGFIMSATVFADHKHLTGVVKGVQFHETHQDTTLIHGANVYWMHSTIGMMTDEQGRFHLEKPEDVPHLLIINYVAFKNDTLFIEDNVEGIEIVLNKVRETHNVTVEEEHAHHHHHEHEVGHQRTISGEGLRTLACCNLSETFESTTDVDVEQTDAVSGAKRIKMLGLAGFYTQILIEKKPVIRGLVSPFGLEYIPGSWMQSIDISKGASSVMSGYESITGQINVEFKKPEALDPMHINLYQNSMGKTEASLIASRALSDRVSTMLLAYGNMNQIKWDHNQDTFADMPLSEHYNIMNRWKLSIPGKMDGQIGFKVIHDHRDGGQVDFLDSADEMNDQYYGFHNKTDRYEFYLKAGRALNTENLSSLGLIMSAYHHKQDAFWGLKSYQSEENSIHTNLIYQYVMEKSKLSTGLSMLWNDYEEYYNRQLFLKTEEVPGGFIEYTLSPSAQWTAVAGIRYDRHNLYGDYWTPRFHLRYTPVNALTLKASAGRGYRTPHLFVENLGIMASSKNLNILEDPKAEEAWNYGVQTIYNFTIAEEKPVKLLADFYRTDFTRQLVIDLEQDATHIYIYNLDGKSYSNSAHAEINIGWTPKIESTIAWRVNDVKSTYQGTLRQVPITNTHKGLFVFSYTTPNDKWQWDLTAQYNGKSRLPDTQTNPTDFQAREESPAYGLLFTQFKRKFSSWEVYLGIENVLDYRQKDPILAWQDPFGPYFDSSLVWGPTIGRKVYIGFRLN